MPNGGRRSLGARQFGVSVAGALRVQALCIECEELATHVSHAMDSLTPAQTTRLDEVLQTSPQLIPPVDSWQPIPEAFEAMGGLVPEVRAELDRQRALLAVIERIRGEGRPRASRAVVLHGQSQRPVRRQRPRSSRRRAQRAAHRATAGPEPPREPPRQLEALSPEGADVETPRSPGGTR